MSGDLPEERTFEGIHGTLTVRRERAGVVVVVFDGTDVGELHDAVFQILDRVLERDGAIELFIDARRGRTVSIGVSNDWALWLRRERARLRRVHMLAATRFLRVTAKVVRQFADLEETMRITSDPAAFDRALGAMAR